MPKKYYTVEDLNPKFVFYNPWLDELFVVGWRTAPVALKLGLCYIGEYY